MPTTFDALPDVPPEVEAAATSGELVVFVGAGISRLVGCPSWEEFATAVLRQLVPKAIDHYELTQIRSIRDPQKQLSIAKILAEKEGVPIPYEQILAGTPTSPNVYTHLNRFRCTFVTTNYEKRLSPDVNKDRPEDEWRYYGKSALLPAYLDAEGSVLHLHGCINDAPGMIITKREYLEHYSSKEVQTFLTDLFARKTVLFLGYGLEETEILEYILRRSEGKPDGQVRRFILQGFFNAEMRLFDMLKEYYWQSFAAKLIGFPRDHHDFDQQVPILEMWAKKLSFSSIALTDEAKALEDEIDD